MNYLNGIENFYRGASQHSLGGPHGGSMNSSKPKQCSSPRLQLRNQNHKTSLAPSESILPLSIIVRLVPVVRMSVRRTLGSRRSQEYADMVQEAWVALLKDNGRQVRAFDPSRGSLEHYIALVIRREVGNSLRRAQTQKRGGGLCMVDYGAAECMPGTLDNPEQAAATQQLARGLEHLMTRLLSARGRIIFSRLFEQGDSPEFTAREMGLDIQVIYNWQHRIRKIAQQFFGL